MARKRIMYIEPKDPDQVLEARIGWVTYSKTGKSLHYRGKMFQMPGRRGGRGNYVDAKTGQFYWISGAKKDGADRQFGENVPIHIDKDVQEEYWTRIREMPDQVGCLIRTEK